MASPGVDENQDSLNPADNDWSDSNVYNPETGTTGLSDAENDAAEDDSLNNESAGGSIGGEFANQLSNRNEAKGKEESAGASVGSGLSGSSGHRFNPDSSSKKISSLATTNKLKLATQLIKLAKERGPLGVVIAVVASVGIAGLLLVGSGPNWLASIKSNLTNVRDMAGPARNMRFSRIMAYQIPQNNASSDEINKACEKPKSRKCRAVTMSEKMKERLEKAGMTVDAEKDDKSGRYRVKSIKIVDDFGREHTVTNRAEFKAAFRQPVFRSIFNRSFDGARSTFFGNNFKNLLSKRFKTSKAPKIDGKDKKEMDKSFRKGMGLSGDPADGDPEKRKANNDSQAKKLSQKISSISKSKKGAILDKVCSVYTGAKALVSTAKAIQIANLVRFTMVFFTEFDRAIAGEATPETASYIGNKLTYSEFNQYDSDGKPNRFYSTTFTDAEGMRMLLHGDIRNLSDYAKKYVVGGGKIGLIGNIVNNIERTIGGGSFDEATNRGSIRSLLSKLTGRNLDSPSKTGRLVIVELCKAMETAGEAGQVAEIARCAKTLSQPLSAALSPLFGIVLSATFCTSMEIAADIILGKIIEKMVEEASQWALEWVSEMDLDEETKGFDVGNAMAAGAGLLMQNNAQTNGLVATNTAGYKEYLANVTPEYSEYIASLRHEARSTPLDGTNQYSFLGSIVSSMYGMRGVGITNKNPISMIKTTLATLPLAAKKVASLSSPNTNALTGTFGDIPEFNENEAKCEDPNLTDDFSGDPFCVPYVHMDKAGLKADPIKLIDYMVNNEFINEETGKALSTKNGEILKNFNKYCITRTLPPGELDPGGSEDGNITKSMDETEAESADSSSNLGFKERLMLVDWQSGYNCSNPNEEVGTTASMLANLSAYTMDNRIYDDMDEKENTGGGDAGSGNITTEDAREAAQALLDSENVHFQTPAQRGYMEETARDGTQCGGSVQMNGKFLGLLVEASKKYQITIGSQASDRCGDSGFHGKGLAIDINGIARPGGPHQHMVGNGGEPYSEIHAEFAKFVDATSAKAGFGIGMGQVSDCGVPGIGSGDLPNTFAFAGDTCNHIHLDGRGLAGWTQFGIWNG